MKISISALLLTAACAAAALGAHAAPQLDRSIEASVRNSFVFTHYLNKDSIKVESKDGAVTLTGRVSQQSHKDLAYEAALAQGGVTGVDDRLALGRPAPADGSDAWLAEKVRALLLFHRSVSAVDTKVSAKDGVVTLRGRAENQAQKDLTEEYARDVKGVAGVVNAMTVAKAPGRKRRAERKIDDASVTAEVKLALLFHRSTSALSTQVATTGGVVTLSGKAASMAEKDLAGKIAGDVKGVKSVENRIRLD
jgi:osmotically-inducible protein OsmY